MGSKGRRIVSVQAGDRSLDRSQLHHDIGHSTFHSVPGSGHMVHQTATREVMAAIDEAAGETVSRQKPHVIPPAG